MKILFIHQNFPGQFMHLAPALVEQGHEVAALSIARGENKELAIWNGVTMHYYKPAQGSTKGVHPWVVDLETKVIRGEALFHKALQMKEGGYTPDLIVAHPGWGESVFVKEVWPDTKLALYSEYFYKTHGGDVNFDPEFSANDVDDACKITLKNVNNLLHFPIADAGISPTLWQASSYPKEFADKITVIHDGIDTNKLIPNPEVKMTLNTAAGEVVLDANSEIITFVNRNLEPYRGYHIFMRALPEILKERPNARVLILGGNEVSYGAPPPAGQTWRDIFLHEVKDRVDLSRIHFLGKVDYAVYQACMQLSSVHVYLTYPFVLSWSLLEAMSMGCAIVASNTAPVQEVIKSGKTGRLVDFFDAGALAKEVIDLLGNPAARKKLGTAARKYAVENYDLQSVCLPQQLAWVEGLFKKQYKSTKKIIAKKETIKTKAKVIGLKS